MLHSSTGASAALDGHEKSILVNGYSTSYAWPAMLQDMLDDHTGGKRVYHVLNAVVGGAPVESWIASPGSRDYARTVAAMDRDFFGPNARLRNGAPAPTIAICQQSLQLTGDERGPVKSEYDMAGAEFGADAMEQLAALLHDRGVEEIYITTHIYKKPVEPEVGNERIALDRLLSRGVQYIHRGPDVWTPSRDCHPDCFTADGLHPNAVGMKMLAQAWYQSLAGASAKQAVVDTLWARDYDVDQMMRDYLAWRRGE